MNMLELFCAVDDFCQAQYTPNQSCFCPTATAAGGRAGFA